LKTRYLKDIDSEQLNIRYLCKESYFGSGVAVKLALVSTRTVYNCVRA